MPEPASPTAPPALGRNALRIVLFGMPDAGKSSLLGALSQAAQTQEHVLNGHLTDLSSGLAELQRRVYEGTPRETLDEVIPYPVTFEPFAVAGGRSDRLGVTLIDCDGRVANELLSRRRSLDEAANSGALAAAVLEADALVLAIDVSAPASQVDADFREFGRFLRLLRTSRGHRTDIGGLPVFLVLTKCDLLAQPGETAAAWAEHIEERKRWVDRRFHDFLARQSADEAAPFGGIDLHVWATAVRLPALAGSPARPSEPYGVAELFRQCLESAQAFRGRRRQSGRRLLWTVGGTTGVVAAMVGLAAGLVYYRADLTVKPVAAHVNAYRSTEGQTPSARLREPLQQKISELTDLKNDPDFASLPEKDQDYVRDRLQELQEYRAFKDKLQRVRPETAQSVADLDRMEDRLTTELVPPARYKQEWSQTEAALLRNRVLKDVDSLRAAVGEAAGWYQQQLKQADRLRTFAGGKPGNARDWREWESQADQVLHATFPHTDAELLPDSDQLTYAAVFHLDGVMKARTEWETARTRLERVRDLTVLLGLADVPDRPALLDIPQGFTVEQAAARLQQLQRAYPQWQQELAPGQLPDAVALELRQAADKSYQRLIGAGRDVVLQHLRQAGTDGQETPEAWRAVLRDWLSSPRDLRDWRILATALNRFREARGNGEEAPAGGDPVTALADFLRQDSFRLELQRLTLEVPFDRKLTPAGPLTIFHQHGTEKTELAFKLLDDEGRRDAQKRTTTYTLVRDGGAAVVYQPGDRFWASVPVKREGDAAEWMLTWGRFHSQLYQFECLARPPRLHRKAEENTSGELLEDVVLTVAPAGGMPRVPDLMPVVKLK